jgi:hypothetical protein
MEIKQAYIELIIALKSDERIELNPNLFPDLEIIKIQIANFTWSLTFYKSYICPSLTSAFNF